MSDWDPHWRPMTDAGIGALRDRIAELENELARAKNCRDCEMLMGAHMKADSLLETAEARIADLKAENDSLCAANKLIAEMRQDALRERDEARAHLKVHSECSVRNFSNGVRMMDERDAARREVAEADAAAEKLALDLDEARAALARLAEAHLDRQQRLAEAIQRAEDFEMALMGECRSHQVTIKELLALRAVEQTARSFFDDYADGCYHPKGCEARWKPIAEALADLDALRAEGPSLKGTRDE